MSRKPRKSPLAETHPELAQQWHLSKNGKLLPENQVGVKTKIWWQCSNSNDHVWEASIASRKKGVGCPFCAGKKVSYKESIHATHPEIVKHWHPYKNDGLLPTQVSFGSKKNIWWICDHDKNHIWKETLNRITSRKNFECRICASLNYTHPEIARFWHPSKNGDLSSEDVTYNSGKKVWWKCPEGDDHEWDVRIADMHGTGCRICSGKRVVRSTSIVVSHPHLTSQWHPTLNKLYPEKVNFGSKKIVWWKCDVADDHIWKGSINSRTSHGGRGCPFCAGKRVSKTNRLSENYPEIVQQWHPSLNKNLKPNDIISGSSKKVWWKCDIADDHIWKASIVNRTQKDSGCPMCSKDIIVESNCLSITHPEIALLWHPTLNGNLKPNKVASGSNKKVWWKCPKGEDHEWKTTPNNISSGQGCPVCAHIKIVRSNSFGTYHPDLLKEWNFDRNVKVDPFKISSSDSVKVSWICAKNNNHKWKASVGVRVYKNTGCPSCSGSKGEDKIEKYLFTIEMPFETQKKFEGLKVKGKLKCDFFIPKINTVIEFNGNQHYESVDYWGGKEGLAKRKKHDKIKESYCKENGINFEVIRYDEDVETRMNEILEKYSL